MVGYMESGNIKIGAPITGVTLGKYELPGGVRLQVIGVSSSTTRAAKALRCLQRRERILVRGGGCRWRGDVADGRHAEWERYATNIIVVAANENSNERECQVSVSVGR